MAKRKRKQSTDESVSNATVAVLLILTIIVSIIGTWSVLQSADTIQEQASAAPKNTESGVKLLIGTSPLLEALRHAESQGNVQREGIL